MANAGVSQEIRMKLTGHVSAEMNKGYTHHELEPPACCGACYSSTGLTSILRKGVGVGAAASVADK
jgi:hypothetical protein